MKPSTSSINRLLLLTFSSLLLALTSMIWLASPTQADGPVGTGTPASCTEAALTAALATDGTVTFNCGPEATILLTSRITLFNRSLVLDGGSASITLARDPSAPEFNLFRLTGVSSLEVHNLTLKGGKTVTNTQEDNGGAASVGEFSTMLVENSTIMNNQAYQGGAFFSAGKLTIRNSAILSNTSTPGDGGGIRTSANLNSKFTMVNSTVAYNVSANKGGAVSNNITTTASIINSTIAFNQSQFSTGGIFQADVAASIQITDTIVAGNTAMESDKGDCLLNGNSVTAGTFDSTNGSCGGTGNDLVLSRLGALGNYGGTTPTIPLGVGHPAIDGAIRCRSDLDLPLTTDQRGEPRSLGAGCDAGSFEHKSIDLTLSGPGNVNEGAGVALITATLSEATPGPFVVMLTTSTDSNGATADSDYIALTTQPFTIPANSTSHTFMINIIDDTIDEFTEQFTVTLQTPITGAQVLGTTVFPIIIEDNDAEPAISINDTSKLETSASGEISFDVTLDNPNGSGKSIEVTYTSAEGTATSGADFSAATDTITFDPGEVTKKINLRIIPDSQQEADETLTVQLSDPVNATIADGIATGTIIDDDAPGQVFIEESDNGTAVTEGGQNDTYIVVLSSQPTANVTVTVDPDSQLDVGNGANAPSVLTFTTSNWNTPQTVTVMGTVDFVDEADPHTGIIVHSVSSSDTLYNGFSLGNITVSITDSTVVPFNLYFPVINK